MIYYVVFHREGQSRAKVLSNMIKQKRKEKAVSIGVSDTCSSLLLCVLLGEMDSTITKSESSG